MEKLVKVETKNSENKRIEKMIPINLLSQYQLMGWKLVEKKEEKTNFTNYLNKDTIEK